MNRRGISKIFFWVALVLCLTVALKTQVVAAADNPNKETANKIAKAIDYLKDNKTSTATATTVKNSKTSPASTAKSAPPAKTENVKAGLITDIRWANHVDAITGEEKIRVVVDMSSPVKAQGTLISSLKNQLTVTILGAKPDNINALKTNLNFNGKIISKAAISVDGKDTKIVFDLPEPILEDEYRIFTLNKDPIENKPFRVVADINKPLPLPDFSFTDGLKDKVIAIDPGHGGTDPGAIGYSKTMEKKITLAVSEQVKALLEKEGSRVIMTRTDDRDVYGANSSAADELGARVGIANNRKADIFISIHNDSFTNQTVGGTSTFYYQKTIYDVMLANSLQKSLLKAGGLQDRRANSSNLYVVKHTRMPATLIELAFLSNPGEEKLLNSPEFQQKMAKGIVDGIKDFFEQAAKLRGDK